MSKEKIIEHVMNNSIAGLEFQLQYSRLSKEKRAELEKKLKAIKKGKKK